MDDIKEGSIDLAEQSIDLEDIESAYDEDLDKEDNGELDQQAQDAGAMVGMAPAGEAPAPALGGGQTV